MAFTKITNAGFGLTTGTLVGVAASFSSTVSVGGTLTYEDVTNVDSVGLITARNGIEVTDKGVQVGTGATVDSAADNTLTFLTNGDERLRITSAGKLLVGITSSSGSHILEVNSGTDNEGIKVVSTDAGSYIRFADNSTTGSTRLGAVGDEFKIDVASAERLRITSDGDVLIGATSGNLEKLRVQDNATTGTSCQLSIISGNAERGILNFGDAEDHNIGRISYHHSDNALFFHTNNTERLRIDSSGRLLVGTSSDFTNGTGTKLQSIDPSGGQIALGRDTSSLLTGYLVGRLRWYGNVGGTAEEVARISVEADDTHALGDKPGRIRFLTTADGESSPTERLRITSSGDIGIGETTPLGNLHIKSGDSGASSVGSAADELVLENSTDSGMTFLSGTSGFASINFADSGDANVGQILYSHGSNYLAIKTNDLERLRIDSSGRLLVGSSSSRAAGYGDNASLQLEGTTYPKAAFSAILNVNNTDGPSINFAKTRGTSNGSSTVVQSGDNLGVLNFSGGDGTDISSAGARIRAQVDGTPGSNDMPGRIIFETTPDGSVSPTERMRIDSSGVLKINQSSTANIFRIQNTTSNESSMLIQNSTTGLNAGNGLYIGIGGDETSYFWAYHNENMTFATNNTARMTIFAAGKLRVPGVYAGTTTGGSAVYVESDGDMLRYTSSLKYKTDVETIEDAKADAILNCRPVWYRSKCANDIKTEGSEKSDWGWYGFIAEEVAEIEPRLVNWATKDAVRQEDGELESVERDPADYEAEGVRYDNFVPLLVNLAKRQKAQIDALEARIAALEG